jgi:hypothetical protein
MKKILFTAILFLIFLNISYGQVALNKPKAEIAVKQYMSSKSKDYMPIEFGEFFSQYYSDQLQKIANTKDTIKYSIVHTYTLKGRKVVDTYFHLNKSYSVIASNTITEMTKLVANKLKNNPKMDSILNNIQLELK